MNLLRMQLKKHDVWVGLLLMFLFTWPIDLAGAGVLPVELPFAVLILVGYGFVFAALGLTALAQGKPGVLALVKRFWIWKVDRRWYWAAFLLLPSVYALSILLTALLLGKPVNFSSVFAYRIFGPSANLGLLILPYFIFDAITNGEEIGWRGYLLPRLQAKHNGLTASLIVGIFWSAWHIPKFISHWDPAVFFWFTVDTTAKAVLYTWLYNGTGGSLLLTTIFHASGNTAAILLPGPNTVSASGPAEYALMAVLHVVAAAAVVSISGRDLQPGGRTHWAMLNLRRLITPRASTPKILQGSAKREPAGMEGPTGPANRA